MPTPLRRRWRRGALAATGLAVALPLTLSTAPAPAAPGGSDTQESAPRGAVGQPTVEARRKDVLTVGGHRYKDSNGNGRLDPYENWRLPVETRVRDLVARMALREKAGLMLIDTLNAQCVDGNRGGLGESAHDYVDTQQMRRFVFRNTVATPDQAVCAPPDTGFRAGTRPTPGEAATFTNAVQELAEASRLGVPALFKSNARNHIDPDARAGINESAGAFSAFPKEAGIAAAALGEQAMATGEATTGDMSVVEDFARVMGDEWHSIGLRGMYGYMADLSTEPRWYRTHETFTEDANLNAELMGALVGTLQGPVDSDGASLTPDSDVALTMKHFPGGGPQELGFDPHYSYGKTQVYPGDAFGEHLKPFEAAIDAGVSSVMPYYGVPVGVTHDGTTYDQKGFAFSEQVIDGLLREDLGFRGYVNSDTGIINDRAWGLEGATVPERVAAAVNSGTDTLSGFHTVQTIVDLVEGGLVSGARVTEAAERLVTPLFRLGLFEDPYVDPAAADATVGRAAHREVGLELQRKSAVLLQNDEVAGGEDALPIPTGSKVYVLGNIQAESVEQYGYEVVDGNAAVRPSAEGSDRVVISMTARATNTSGYDSRVAASDPRTPVNPVVLDGVRGLDGKSPFGAADACMAYGAEECTDNSLVFGGSLPWEAGILDFSGMAESESWQVTPSLDTIKQVVEEVGDPDKVVLHVYFRQPFVLDEASGLRDAGAVVAGFGTTDRALMDVLSGQFAPQGRMPFALAGTRAAIEQQFSDLPGYAETQDGALFPFGHGLTYEE